VAGLRVRCVFAGALFVQCFVLGTPADAADFGRQNYIQHCAGCHAFDGSGSPANGVPNMNGAVGHFLRLPEGRAFLIQVPGTSQARLSDAEIAELLNWMVARFSKDEIPKGFTPYTKDEVTKFRALKLNDVMGTRREIVRKLRGMGMNIN
jgi:mono/diheme cytochrome c family protein